MQQGQKGLLHGWRLTGLVGAALLAGAAGLVLVDGGGVDGLRQVVRFTARTSVFFFLLAFTASSLAVLLPSSLTRWQIRNRRYLGLSFAVSHLIHAAALILLYRTDAALFWSLTNVVNIVTAGAAYVFILLMAATSFDGAVAWLGRGRWRVLHTAGSWYIWVSFMVAFGKRIAVSEAYLVPVAFLLLAVVLRLVAWFRRRARRAQA